MSDAGVVTDMEEQNDYINALKWQLGNLAEKIDGYKQEMQALLLNIDEAEQQAEHIVKLLEAEGIMLNGDKIAATKSPSVADMAYEVLETRQEQEPVHYRDLADQIMAGGKYIPGQDPAANLLTYLNRDARFVRTGRGIYGLSEWGIRAAPRKRSRKKTRRKGSG